MLPPAPITGGLMPTRPPMPLLIAAAYLSRSPALATCGCWAGNAFDGSTGLALSSPVPPKRAPPSLGLSEALVYLADLDAACSAAGRSHLLTKATAASWAVGAAMTCCQAAASGPAF